MAKLREQNRRARSDGSSSLSLSSASSAVEEVTPCDQIWTCPLHETSQATPNLLVRRYSHKQTSTNPSAPRCSDMSSRFPVSQPADKTNTKFPHRFCRASLPVEIMTCDPRMVAASPREKSDYSSHLRFTCLAFGLRLSDCGCPRQGSVSCFTLMCSGVAIDLEVDRVIGWI